MEKYSLVVPASPYDVKKESRYETLNRNGFVRGANDKDQWYLFVSEAWEASKLPKNEVVKAYLVHMLWTFSDKTDLFEKLESFDHFLHLLGIQRPDWRYLMDFADRCLQYVAFFPERSGNRHQPRKLDRVVEMGVGAYHDLVRLSAGKDDALSSAFREMAKSFGLAVMVLRSGCPRFAYQRVQQEETRRGYTRHQLSMMDMLTTEENRRHLARRVTMRFYVDNPGLQGSRNN